jgi:hypothetical protein
MHGFKVLEVKATLNIKIKGFTLPVDALVLSAELV